MKKEKKYRRHKKIRAKMFGKAEKPRLCVFRSAKHLYAQLIDDEKKHTLITASDLEIKTKKKILTSQHDKKDKELFSAKTATAYEVGRLIAEKALKNKIEKVVFDRGGYKYHGRVRAVAEGAREGGLKF